MPGPPMHRRSVILAAVAGLAAAVATPGRVRGQGELLNRGLERLKGLPDGGTGGLSDARIGRGLKQALEMASRSVIDRVGQPGGYLRDQAIRIPLPGFLASAQRTLGAVGAAGQLDRLETRLNRAAERAAPRARELFLDAIGEMTVGDARGILAGPDDAATRYFQRTMTPDLKAAFRPIVEAELQKVGAVAALDDVARRLEAIPFASLAVADPRRRLVEHGVDGALEGIFHYLAREEAAIRSTPAKRTTELLRDVFG